MEHEISRVLSFDDIIPFELENFLKSLSEKIGGLEKHFTFDSDGEVVSNKEDLDVTIFCQSFEGYVPASGPSYGSGGEPEEGGFAEDITVILYIEDEEIDITDSITQDKMDQWSYELYDSYAASKNRG